MNIDQTALGALNRIVQSINNNKVAIGSEAITVSSTAIPFSTIPAGTTSAIFSIEKNQIRYRENGVPTTRVGHIGAIGDLIEIQTSQNVSSFRIIATDSDATIFVTYYSN